MFVFSYAFKYCYFVMLLIFSFMFDFVSKVVQLKARLEERDFTTLLQRRDVEVNDIVWSSIPNVAILHCSDTYELKL